MKTGSYASAGELAVTRAGLLEYRQAAREQDSGLARQLASYLYLGRTLTFDADLEARQAKPKPEDVRKAMARHVDWSKPGASV